MVVYTPNADDALFEDFDGAALAFADPKVYDEFSATRIDSVFFLKPITDEVLNLIRLVAPLTTQSTQAGMIYSGPENGPGRPSFKHPTLANESNPVKAAVALTLFTNFH